MYLVHPALQIITTLLMIYVFSLGFSRFRSRHLKSKTMFNWKRHVLLGKITIAMMTTGFFGGAVIVGIIWSNPLATGLHGYIGYIMFPLLIAGLFGGIYLDKKKKNSDLVALIHGIINTTVLVLAIIQVITGYMVYRDFF